MLKYISLIISLMIIFFFMNAPSVWSVPSSPAGGGCLALDGEDDYAVLDSILFKEGTMELTVEAWVYPSLTPDKDTYGTILSQQVYAYVVSYDNPWYQDVKEHIIWEKGDLLLCMLAYMSPHGGNANTGHKLMTLSPYEWHHIAFQIQHTQKIWICDNLSESSPQGMEIEHNLLTTYLGTTDFVLGGCGRKVRDLKVPSLFMGSFAGYIDEVRFSTVPRYDIRKNDFTPKGRFEPDADTVALWHFDEGIGAEIFLDSSGNGYHLVGKNGAITLAVGKQDKLATTWADIKANTD